MLTLPMQIYKSRRSKGISQIKLSDISGIPLSRIRGLENGCPYKDEELLKILSILNVDIKWQDETQQKCELIPLQPIKPLREPGQPGNGVYISSLTIINTAKEAKDLAELNIVKAYFDRYYPKLDDNSNNNQRVMIRRLNQQIVEATAVLRNKVDRLESEYAKD